MRSTLRASGIRSASCWPESRWGKSAIHLEQILQTAAAGRVHHGGAMAMSAVSGNTPGLPARGGASAAAVVRRNCGVGDPRGEHRLRGDRHGGRPSEVSALPAAMDARLRGVGGRDLGHPDPGAVASARSLAGHRIAHHRARRSPPGAGNTARLQRTRDLDRTGEPRTPVDFPAARHRRRPCARTVPGW